MKLDIVNLEGKNVGSVELPADVFGLEVRKDLLHRAVNWQLAKRRVGTASTLTRAEVSRTGKKLHRQKGTGGARHGSRRVNIFVGGGIVFGPKPRSFATDLTKKVRALALKTALSAKAKSGSVIVLDEAKTKTHKTKDLAAALLKLNASNACFIVGSVDDNFDKASRNLPHVRVLPTTGANVYDILRAEKLVITKEALPLLQARLSGVRQQSAEKEAK